MRCAPQPDFNFCTMHVILVHGFFNRGGILGRLAAHLVRAGHTCYTPTLKPFDARNGLPDLSTKLDEYISQNLPADTRFALVGFSMGAIVCRHYFQKLSGAQRVLAFYSIAGPHEGTWTAYFYPSLGVRQLRRGSRFLRELNDSADEMPSIPVTCYWTPIDLMICPVSSARWVKGEAVCIPTLMHSLLIFNKKLFVDIAERLSAISPDEALIQGRSEV